MATEMQKNDRDKDRLERVQQRPYLSPRVDVFENKDEILLLADLPGVTQDALRLNLDDEHIELEALAPAEPASAVLGREFRRVDFRRSFVMPAGVDRERVSAELKQGVLWLRLPKSAAARPRRIAVTTG